MKVISANWYDFPQYYDLAFQDETAREVSFFRAAFSRYAPDPCPPGVGAGLWKREACASDGG